MSGGTWSPHPAVRADEYGDLRPLAHADAADPGAFRSAIHLRRAASVEDPLRNDVDHGRASHGIGPRRSDCGWAYGTCDGRGAPSQAAHFSPGTAHDHGLAGRETARPVTERPGPTARSDRRRSVTQPSHATRAAASVEPGIHPSTWIPFSPRGPCCANVDGRFVRPGRERTRGWVGP